MLVSHDILVAGPSLDVGAQKVARFFLHYELVRYDDIRVVRDKCLAATEADFPLRIEAGVAANRRIVAEVIDALRQEGVNSWEELQHMSQGYGSKMLHTLAHVLDGFFGIDTIFYNLPEDSHWISAQLQQEILASPANYWLVAVEAEFMAETADRARALRAADEAGARARSGR